MALQLFITVLQPTGDTAHVMTLQVLHLPVVFHWQFLAGSWARCLLEQAVAAPLEEAYIVNTSEMPLFQFLSAPCRAAVARRRPQSLPLLELELVYPAFASQPVNNLAICIQWFAKKPKQLPQPRFHHLPLAVPEDAASSLTLTFQLLSGEDLASCVVAIPWVCNFEVLSHQLEVDMKLIHVVITPSVKGFLSCEALAEIGHEGTVHVGALALVKPGSLTLQCLRKSVVNLRTALDPPSMPTGWRRWYHEFKSLVTSLPLVPFEVVASDGTPTFVLDRFGEAPVVELAPVVLQAFAFARRRAQQEQACRRLQQQLGRAVLPQLPVKCRTWAGCRHAIMLKSQRPLYEVRSFMRGFCDAHRSTLDLIAEEIERNGPETYFA